MKRPIIFALAAIMAATSVSVLAGCGSSGQKSDTKSAAATEAAASSGNAAGSTIAAADTVFTFNGASIELNTDIQAVVQVLGDPSEITEQTTCHGTQGGNDKTYKYDGFTITTYPKDNQDFVMEINVTSPAIPTAKGVKVGDTADAVKAAYGENYDAIAAYYAYKTDDGKSIQFLIPNGTVEEIDYYYDV